jgi:GrpB-like predicted nucleotidyltransferase (UPF0157 family)
MRADGSLHGKGRAAHSFRVTRGIKAAACVGLRSGSVRVLPYDPEWPREFRKFRRLLRPLFPGARIEQIGSTSVVGCRAKPLIDVSVGLRNKGSLHLSEARAAGLEFRMVRSRSVLFNLLGPTGVPVPHVHARARDSEPEARDLPLPGPSSDPPRDGQEVQPAQASPRDDQDSPRRVFEREGALH